MTIKELVRYALGLPNHKQTKISLGKLSECEAETIMERTKLDVKGFDRVIDNYAIKHIHKKHGNEQTEANRGQISVGETDYERIPEIIEKGEVGYSGKNDIGNHTLSHIAELDVLYCYVEEVRNGKKELAGQTLYKRKNPSNNRCSTD